MASRRKNNDEGGVSLDSLMDALTNVVAVLILILILLQVDVSNMVEKLLGELKPATPEQIEAAKLEHQQLIRQIERQQELLKAPAPSPDAVAAVQKDIALLETSLKDSETKLMELKKIQELADKTRIVSDDEKKKTETILTEISRIEALLDETPKPEKPAPTIVRLPNSRDIPEDANIYYCYIHGDQAHLVDVIDASQRVMAVFDRNKNQLLSQRIKVKNKPDRLHYDQQKVVELITREKLTVRGQQISVPLNRTGYRLSVNVTFDPKKGDATLEDMMKPKGRFHNVCNLVASYPRRVLIFKVHPNGFATYLKAREIADSYRIPCGWEIDTSTVARETLPFTVKPLDPPPPPKPGGPPPPTKPKRQLD